MCQWDFIIFIPPTTGQNTPIKATLDRSFNKGTNIIINTRSNKLANHKDLLTIFIFYLYGITFSTKHLFKKIISVDS